MNRFSLLLLSAVVAISSAACTKKGQNIEVDGVNGEKLTLPLSDTLRINLTSEPPSLDWHKASDTTSAWVLDNTMVGLTAFNLDDKELGLEPALALKWEPSEGNKHWKFTLRQGVVWTDGQPFTAQNVVDSWHRLLARETAAMYAYFLFPLKNGQAFNQGKVPWEQVGVKITAPDVVEVELEKPMAFFPILLTHASTFPIRKDIVDKFGDKWTEASNVVTLGPYKMKTWQHDKMIILERNDKYFETEKPSIKYIAAYMIQEQGTAINLFDSGKLDSVHKLPSVELRKLKDRKEFRKAGSLLQYYYGFNTKKKPLDNVLVRKAIAMAIDKNEIVNMLAGGQTPLTSWVPPGMFGYEPSIGIPFDAAKAKETLKQAGYADPMKLPKIELKFNTNEDHSRVAENVQAQLKRNLGIDVELKNEEWKVYINTLNTDPPQIFRMGWMADYPDPDNFLNLMTSYSDNNHTKWGSKKYDDLIMQAASEGDKEKRRSLYQEAQKLLLEEETPVVPLYAGVNLMLISTRVENYPVNVLEKYNYKRTKLK